MQAWWVVLVLVWMVLGSWSEVGEVDGATLHSLSFCNASTAFAVGELGIILVTRNGGAHWDISHHTGFPFYYYGVQCFGNKVLVVGFDDTRTDAGILLSSHDSGASWDPVQYVPNTGWFSDIRFSDSNNGIISILTGDVITTTDGGENWNIQQIQNSIYGNLMFEEGFFSGSGTAFCSSAAFPQIQCVEGPDPGLDGGAWWIPNSGTVYVGGGIIQPRVAGFVHKSVNNGTTWVSVMNATFPIRGVWFLTPSVGIAYGGNFFSSVGGVFETRDGGSTWDLLLKTKTEIWGYDVRSVKPGVYQVYLVGGGQNSEGYFSALYTNTYVL